MDSVVIQWPTMWELSGKVKRVKSLSGSSIKFHQGAFAEIIFVVETVSAGTRSVGSKSHSVFPWDNGVNGWRKFHACYSWPLLSNDIHAFSTGVKARLISKSDLRIQYHTRLYRVTTLLCSSRGGLSVFPLRSDSQINSYSVTLPLAVPLQGSLLIQTLRTLICFVSRLAATLAARDPWPFRGICVNSSGHQSPSGAEGRGLNLTRQLLWRICRVIMHCPL